MICSIAAAVVVAGCGGSTGSASAPAKANGASSSSSSSSAAGGPAVSSAALDKTISTVLQGPVPADSLPPLMKEALERASVQLTPAQLDKAFECWQKSACTIGNGKITLAEADGFGDNTWRKFSKMDVILQALTYPEVGKFIYTNAHGDLSQFQSAIRTLTAQGAKAVVAYNDFGPAAYPAFTAAQRAGVHLSTFVGPADGAPTSAITTRVQPDICEAGKVMGTVTKQAVGNAPIAYFTGTPGNPEDTGWQKCASQQGLNPTFKADTNWTPAGAQKAASALIASGKSVKAILYSYSNPVPNIVTAFQKAGMPTPAIITWTTDNGTLCQLKQHPYTLYLTNALNWAARVSVTAMVKATEGASVSATVIYPMPFNKADPANCDPAKPADYPGTSALVPDQLVSKILGG